MMLNLVDVDSYLDESSSRGPEFLDFMLSELSVSHKYLSVFRVVWALILFALKEVNT